MDGDWETVNAKPKAKKKPANDTHKVHYGGKAAGGTLTAGPIKSGQMSRVADYSSMNNQASAIADFDYHIDDERYEEIKFEAVSHVCAQAVSEARTKKNMTQEKLAHAIGEKTSVIVEIENGTAQYKAGIINNIEKVLNVKIPRGRKGKK